jgi:copper(I)-binding protein
MKHAGMVPVFAEAEGAADGVFRVLFEWTMGGAWIVEARLTLPNGEVANETFSFDILAEAGDDMANMYHSNTDAARDTPGETSAVYMRISNRGASDRVIVAAQSAAAQRIEFHQTIIEDDIARMEVLADLVIPAGGTLELQPGGAHIMLTGLTEDLQPEGSFSLQLKCSAGQIYDLDVSIANMSMGDRDDAVEIGDLVFSNRWARPARVGNMSHTETEMELEANGASG